jgi:hypothetical protein
MARAQKPDFVFRPNGRTHLNRQGSHFSRLLTAEVCTSTVVMLDTHKFRGSVKGTGYPLHSPVSPSLPLPCTTVCHYVSTGLYQCLAITCRLHFCYEDGDCSCSDTLTVYWDVILWCVMVPTAGGTRWRSWLRHCATSRKVAGLIPDSVNRIFY